MRTTTKEQVIEAFHSLPPIPFISVIYGKGKDRRYKAFDLCTIKKQETNIGRLAAFLSEKSLTHNLSSIGYVKGWGNTPTRIEIRLTESKEAIELSNIDADLIQTILNCVSELDIRYILEGLDKREVRKTTSKPVDKTKQTEQYNGNFDPFDMELGMP